MMKLLLSVIILSILGIADAHAQRYIRSIRYVKLNVFDTTQGDWFFAGGMVNALHTVTRDYILDDELLFTEGDELDRDLIEETERNLRRTGLFARAVVTTKNIGEDSVDVVITTQDQWSTTGAVLYGSGGGISTYGARVDEFNLAGTANGIGMQALYRTENDTRWQGTGSLRLRRFLRTPLNINVGIEANRFHTLQSLSIGKPFWSIETPLSYNLSAINNFGNTFLYAPGGIPQLLPFVNRSLSIMAARSAGERDRYFASLLVSVDDIQRVAPQFRQAMDNSGKVLFSLGSLRQNFIKANNVNGYDVEDVPIGAWGMAILGYTFPLGFGRGDGERLYYVGGQAEQSHIFADNAAYVFGHVQAASGFTATEARYTYVESMGIAHWRLSQSQVVAARFVQQTAWNWSAFRQLILDNEAGLRGYPANALTGDNRFIANIEYRLFPDVQVWIFRLGAAAFWDMGTVWRQGEQLGSLRMHHSAGIGIRFLNTKVSGGSAILRLDAAYNFDTRSIGLVFSSNQLFNAFGRHGFRQPGILGSAIDGE